MCQKKLVAMLIENTGIHDTNEIKIDGNLPYASIYCNLLFMIFKVNIFKKHISISPEYSIFDLSQQKRSLTVLPINTMYVNSTTACDALVCV